MRPRVDDDVLLMSLPALSGRETIIMCVERLFLTRRHQMDGEPFMGFA